MALHDACSLMMMSSTGNIFSINGPLSLVNSHHRSLVNSHHKSQWCWDLMFSLICAWINGWVNNREAGDLRCHRAHYDVTVMSDTYIYIYSAIILGMGSANERRRYIVMPPLIVWAHTQNDPCTFWSVCIGHTLWINTKGEFILSVLLCWYCASISKPTHSIECGAGLNKVTLNIYIKTS